MLSRLRRGLTFANVCSALALTIALGTGTAYAAGSVFSEDIVNGEVKTVDLANSAVKTAKIDDGAVTGSKIASNTITAADILGADASGNVNLNAVPNGRCSQVTLSVSGAQVGQIAVISTKSPIQGGIVLYAQRVSSAGQVEADICNFSGTSMSPITDMPVRIITFG